MTPPSSHRARLQALYEMSCYHDAEILLWLRKLCDEAQSGEWSEEVLRPRGSGKGRVQALMKRLEVLRDDYLR